MCLGVPMTVLQIDGFARCSARGIERDVSLFLLQHDPVAPGDFVMVHLGTAMRKIDETEALLTWELLDQVLGASQPAG